MDIEGVILQKYFLPFCFCISSGVANARFHFCHLDMESRFHFGMQQLLWMLDEYAVAIADAIAVAAPAFGALRPLLAITIPKNANCSLALLSSQKYCYPVTIWLWLLQPQVLRFGSVGARGGPYSIRFLSVVMSGFQFPGIKPGIMKMSQCWRPIVQPTLVLSVRNIFYH